MAGVRRDRACGEGEGAGGWNLPKGSRLEPKGLSSQEKIGVERVEKIGAEAFTGKSPGTLIHSKLHSSV
eukprot:2831291-Rhodomonas_salina.3